MVTLDVAAIIAAIGSIIGLFISSATRARLGRPNHGSHSIAAAVDSSRDDLAAIHHSIHDIADRLTTIERRFDASHDAEARRIQAISDRVTKLEHGHTRRQQHHTHPPQRTRQTG